MIQKLAGELRKTKSIYDTGHCTGLKTYDMMKEIMGERLRPIHSGNALLSSAR